MSSFSTTYSNIRRHGWPCCLCSLQGENYRYRQMLASMNINLPFGTADAGSHFNKCWIAAWRYDVVATNRLSWCGYCRKRKDRPDRESNPGHPYFMKGVLTTALPSRFVEESSTPTATHCLFICICVALLRSVMYIECSMRGTKDPYGSSACSPCCASSTTDTPWKERLYPGVEGSWGLFNNNKMLKALTLPGCLHA
jgi:hypothetical protein